MNEAANQRLPVSVAACLALLSLPALAEYESPDARLRLSGFGNISAARTDTDQVNYSQAGRLDGVNNNNLNLKLDSKLAVQARYKISNSVSATAQVISKHTPEGNFKPQADWVYLKWDVNAAWSLRAGRLGGPTFMVSDARDINYSWLTVRLPVDVYGQVPLSTFDGADLSYRFDVADASVLASLWGGSSKQKYASAPGGSPTRATYELKNIVGFNLSASLDNGWSFRVGGVSAKLNIALPEGRFPSPLPPQLAAALADFSPADAPTQFIGVGAAYDRGPWVFNVEYTERHTRAVVPDTSGWYVNTGYRIGTTTPYVGFSRVRVDSQNRTNPLAASLGQPTPAGVVGASVQGFLDGFQIAQQTLTLGMRWDPVDKIALKVQLDRMKKPSQSYGWFTVPEGAGLTAAKNFFDQEKNIHMVTVSLDFVF